MTILRFYHHKARGGKVAFGAEGKPMIQREGGCDAMWQLAKLVGGLWVSDELIEGWSQECRWDHGYIKCDVKGYGNIGLGYINEPQAQAVGMNQESKHPCWKSEKNIHRLDAKQYRAWRYLRTEKEKDEYLAGLFPVAAPIEKVRLKKGQVIAQMNL